MSGSGATGTGDAAKSSSAWDDENVDRLLLYLKTNGFNGDFKILVNHFPNQSDMSLRYFFSHHYDYPDGDERKTIRDAFDKWITIIRENSETQR